MWVISLDKSVCLVIDSMHDGLSSLKGVDDRPTALGHQYPSSLSQSR